MCKTWPFMDDLIGAAYSESALPESLQQKLRERYNAHGGEYVTEELRFPEGKDGPAVPINACMKADTVKDIEEELVDAIFNCLVLSFKASRGGARFHDGVLKRAIWAYGDLQEMR